MIVSDNIIGYGAGGYAWCLTCYKEGAAQAHEGEPVSTISADERPDDDVFCDGCGAMLAETAPGMRRHTEDVELGTPEAG